MNKKVALFSLYPCILKALCKIAGKGEELEKLTGSLLVDSSKIRNQLGCLPAGREVAIHAGRGD
ncbi:MAG: hypothetical protein ABIK26_02770 [Candidatus Omnitrophota bacterium]